MVWSVFKSKSTVYLVTEIQQRFDNNLAYLNGHSMILPTVMYFILQKNTINHFTWNVRNRTIPKNMRVLFSGYISLNDWVHVKISPQKIWASLTMLSSFRLFFCDDSKKFGDNKQSTIATHIVNTGSRKNRMYRTVASHPCNCNLLQFNLHFHSRYNYT